MQTGRWAERWERRQVNRHAEAEDLTHRKPLPSWVTTLLFVPFLVVVSAIAWGQAGPVIGAATVVLLAANHVVGVILGRMWVTDSPSGTGASTLVPRRPFMVTSGLSSIVLGGAMMAVSIGRPGLLLGIGFLASGLMGVALTTFWPKRVGKAPDA